MFALSSMRKLRLVWFTSRIILTPFFLSAPTHTRSHICTHRRLQPSSSDDIKSPARPASGKGSGRRESVTTAPIPAKDDKKPAAGAKSSESGRRESMKTPKTDDSGRRESVKGSPRGGEDASRRDSISKRNTSPKTDTGHHHSSSVSEIPTEALLRKRMAQHGNHSWSISHKEKTDQLAASNNKRVNDNLRFVVDDLRNRLRISQKDSTELLTRLKKSRERCDVTIRMLKTANAKIEHLKKETSRANDATARVEEVEAVQTRLRREHMVLQESLATHIKEHANNVRNIENSHAKSAAEMKK
jgi:hypothetical protein